MQWRTIFHLFFLLEGWFKCLEITQLSLLFVSYIFFCASFVCAQETTECLVWFLYGPCLPLNQGLVRTSKFAHAQPKYTGTDLDRRPQHCVSGSLHVFKAFYIQCPSLAFFQTNPHKSHEAIAWRLCTMQSIHTRLAFFFIASPRHKLLTFCTLVIYSPNTTRLALLLRREGPAKPVPCLMFTALRQRLSLGFSPPNAIIFYLLTSENA